MLFLLMNYENILLTGGSGNLGRAIQGSAEFSNLLAPSHQQLDITQPDGVKAYCLSHAFDAVIHCAALARMAYCEADPLSALKVNTLGTANLVTAVMAKEKEMGRCVRFIHISTDAVYSGTQGNYKESDQTLPYNTYGWTKLGAECGVRLLKNYCIVRTSFFDPKNIGFSESAVDAFSSKVPLDDLVSAIAFLLEHSYIGTLNVGSDRRSDFERYRKYKPGLKPCKLDDIRVSFPIARDASLNCDLWKSITKS